MCTVTFIPVKDQVYISSNRDEKRSRKPAIPPYLHNYNGVKMIFPKDADAGGTWIAMKENGDAAVLLNGAFIKHQPEGNYIKSRGTIIPELLTSDFPSRKFIKTDFNGIEPFTLLLLEKKSLFEFRWDGNEQYCKQLSVNRPHIWSSTTLYDGMMMKKREQWFAEFLNHTPHPTQLDIFNFHQHGGDGNPSDNLNMKREDLYHTVSITGILLNSDYGVMKYFDLPQNKFSEIKIELTGAISLT